MIGTPSTQYRASFMDQKWRLVSGSSCRYSGNPFWMYSARDRHSSSMDAAATIRAHVTVLNLGSCSYVELNGAFIVLSMVHAASPSIAPVCPETAECLDVQSGAAVSLPGSFFFQNLYIKERSLRLNSLGFLMSSIALSEKILIRGLWSTVTNSSGHPNASFQSIYKCQCLPFNWSVSWFCIAGELGAG